PDFRGGQSRIRIFFFFANNAKASGSTDGATISSTNLSESHSAHSSVTGEVKHKIPPKAETGSPSQARSSASKAERPEANPQGFKCSTTATTGLPPPIAIKASLADRRAASASKILL